MDENFRYFPQKTGSIFPDQEPHLFFGRNAPPGIPGVPHNLLNIPFFTLKGTRLNAPVFFRLKRPVSKTTRLNE